MSEKPEQTRVSFDSGGVELVGYLYHAANADGDTPWVVMGHGFSGTQDRLFVGAERFAGAGFAALTFDYRSFGKSGQPRQLVSIKGQLEDWRAAIRFARTLEGVDPERIALWGLLAWGRARYRCCRRRSARRRGGRPDPVQRFPAQGGGPLDTGHPQASRPL